MANNNTINTPVDKLRIPNISDVSFSSDLHEAFNTINSNFETLSNYEFVKGDSGNSVEFSTITFKYLDLDGISFEDKLKSCILEGNTNGEGEYGLVNIDGINYDVFSNFDPDTKFGMIYEVPSFENSIKKPINSIYYIFLDGRFANANAKIADENQYITLRDFSTVLVYDGNAEYTYTKDGETKISKGAFKKAATFPTMYYEEGVGVCWNINGSYTGIPVQGIPGKDGLNAKIHIVKAENTDIENNYKVVGIHDTYQGYLELDNKNIDINSYSNQTAVILVGEQNDMYFGTLYIDNNELYVKAESSTTINYAASIEGVIGALKGIDLYNNGEEISEGLKGLFIPLEPAGADGEQKVHLMTATAVRNLKDDNDDLRTDIVFTPINDINSLNLSKNDDSVSLNIDRFLYLRLNDNCKFLKNGNINNVNLYTTTNGYLKYKLVDIIKDPKHECFSVYAVNNTEGSRYYGKISDEGTIKTLSENNTCFYVNEKFEDNHYESMPESFKNALNADNNDKVGVYKWELYDKFENFDVDELSEFVNNDSDKGQHYMFDVKFKNIYTTTLTPSIDSEFMWFNAMQTSDGVMNNMGEYIVEENGKYIIPGWSINDDLKTFKFIKHVPVVVNDFLINNDNAFNINYNVNITGDEKYPKRNFSVHGDINTDNINVYGAVNAKVINNIYTDDVITTTKGLNVVGENNESAFYVSSNGTISANSVIAESFTAENEIISNDINTKSLNVVNSINITPSETASINAYLSENEGIAINVINTDKINIYSENKESYNSITDAPVITSSVPTHYNSNANIIISNQSSDSDNVYFKNTQNKDAGTGVSKESYIKNTSFESAKNFNIHRLSGVNLSTDINDNTPNNSGSNTIINEIFKSDFITKYFNNDRIICTAENEKYESTISCKSNLNNFDDIAIQSSILGGGGNNCLNSNADMQISFSKDFIFDIGVTCECINSKWPCLTNTSSLTLSLWYSIDGQNPVMVENSKVKYNFPSLKGNGNATLKSNISNDNGYEWKGYSKDGSKDYSSNYKEVCRYYTYKIKPQQMKIPYTSSAYKKIVEAYNAGSNNITIYVIPEFNIDLHSQKNKKCLKKVEICSLRTAVADNITPNNTLKNILNKKEEHIDASTKISGTLLYNVSVITSSNNGSSGNGNIFIPNEKTTTICNDGIVMRAGNYVFGLGYVENAVDHSYKDVEKSGNYKVDNTTQEWIATSDEMLRDVPVLFYYQRNSNGSLGTNTSEDYARKMNAIPLEDLFNVIKYLRSNNDNLSQYGL